MTADELRELADVIEPMGQAPRFSHVNVPAACAYLRACADAMDAGPVAWTDGCGSAVTRAELKGREPHEFTADQDMLAYRIPLYPVAMPAQAQPLRLPEPMAEDELLDTYAHTPGSIACALRAIEAEVLRRVKDVNNAVVMPASLRLPEPMTDEEVAALIDETEGMETDRAVRYLVETGVRRVKEANE